MSPRAAVAAAFLVFACVSLAQAQWFITERVFIPQDCGKPERLKSYIAYKVDTCFAAVGTNGSYTKYTCATDGVTLATCTDSACASCNSSAKVSFLTCQVGAGSDYYASRCGALPAGAEGLSVISYTGSGMFLSLAILRKRENLKLRRGVLFCAPTHNRRFFCGTTNSFPGRSNARRIFTLSKLPLTQINPLLVAPLVFSRLRDSLHPHFRSRKRRLLVLLYHLWQHYRFYFW